MNAADKEKRLKISRLIQLGLAIFIGLGAYLGGICFLIEPSGKILQMEEMISYFKVLPFSDYLFKDYFFSGIALIIVNGLTNTISSILLLKKKKAGYYLGTIFGLTLMAWITIQFIIFPLNLIDILYFLFGLFQLISGICSIVFYKQTNFYFNANDYPNIDPNSKTLVVYFSRMGYSKKLAYQIANAYSGALYEIKVKEKWTKTSGFWWCGRYGMHRYPMTLDEKIALNQYNKIILVGQIWVFSISSPLRAFLEEYSTILNQKLDCVYLTHFNSYIPKKAAYEINKIIKKTAQIKSYQAAFGNLKRK